MKLAGLFSKEIVAVFPFDLWLFPASHTQRSCSESCCPPPFLPLPQRKEKGTPMYYSVCLLDQENAADGS